MFMLLCFAGDYWVAKQPARSTVCDLFLHSPDIHLGPKFGKIGAFSGLCSF